MALTLLPPLSPAPSRLRQLLARLTARTDPVAGLTHIWCTACGRDLDWAQPEFVKLHPAPLCWRCRQAVIRRELERVAVLGALPEGD